jgi:hypothetical protein
MLDAVAYSLNPSCGTLAVLEVLACSEVKVVFGQHPEDFELVVGRCDVRRSIETCIY